MDIDQVTNGQSKQSMETLILRKCFAMEMYSRQFVKDVWSWEMAAMREGVDFTGNSRVPVGSQYASTVVTWATYVASMKSFRIIGLSSCSSDWPNPRWSSISGSGGSSGSNRQRSTRHTFCHSTSVACRLIVHETRAALFSAEVGR
jgi:hypothetical protein